MGETPQQGHLLSYCLLLLINFINIIYYTMYMLPMKVDYLVTIRELMILNYPPSYMNWDRDGRPNVEEHPHLRHGV